MNAFSTALIPIIVLIIIGYSLKKIHFLSDETWSGIEKLTYFILFPALLIQNEFMDYELPTLIVIQFE